MHIRIRLSIPIIDLGIKSDQAQAWSLDLRKVLILELDFGRDFLDFVTSPSVAIGQAVSITHALEPFRMSWSLANMLRAQFFSTPLEKLSDSPYSVEKIERIMEATEVDFTLAKEALDNSKGDVDRAIELLFSKVSRTELVRQTSTNNEHALHERRVAWEENDRASLSDALRQLAVTYNVPASVVRLAMSLEETEDGVKRLLSSSETLKQLMTICDESKFQDNFPNYAADVLELDRKKSTDRHASSSSSSSSSSTSTSTSSNSKPSTTAKKDNKSGKDNKGDKRADTAKDSENVEPGADEIAMDPSEAWSGGGRWQGLTAEQVGVASYWVNHSHFVRLLLFFERRILEANRFCLICTKPMEFEGFKPAVCCRTLCTMAFEDLGLGFNLANEILENPEVTDLYITFAYSSCQRKSMHFIVPINCRAKNPITGEEDTFRLPSANKDNVSTGRTGTVELKNDAELLDQPRLMRCLEACPSVKELCTWAEKGQDTLKAELNKLDILLYPLLRWIFTSTRAHIRPLKPSERIKEVPSKAQFALLSSTPEREARFQRLKHGAELHRGQGKGSFYTWHGSSTSNWHSILRTGLKNLSNTSLMSTGAAYGAGIYMATDSSTSISYCRDGQAWPKSMFGRSYKCLCLCEVVNHKDVPTPNPYYVIQQEGWITTRFFFVIDDNSQFNVMAASLQDKVPKLSL